MKAIIFYGLLLYSFVSVFAQDTAEVQTKSIKIEDFITYVASLDTSPTEQCVYLALEFDNEVYSSEERFYLEQGIKLLSTRVTDKSLIAFGSYGAMGQLILPYTPIGKLEPIAHILTSISLGNKDSQTDGIDLAFETAAAQLSKGVTSTVIILRNSRMANKSENSLATNSSNIKKKDKTQVPKKSKIGGAIALTALSILPEVLEIIKN